jgi:hypothetical protein
VAVADEDTLLPADVRIVDGDRHVDLVLVAPELQGELAERHRPAALVAYYEDRAARRAFRRGTG